METKRAEGKRSINEVVGEEEEEEEEEEGEEEEEEDDDDDGGGGGGGGGDDIIVEEENKKKRVLLSPCGVRKVTNSSGGSTQPSCQVDNCEDNLKEAKPYHRRHKVCELHFKAPAVTIAGIQKRFCQQCSRFHDVSEFDEAKRSCRRRLAGHNERRRKTSCDSHGDG